MSKVSNRTKIATALVGVLALASSNLVVADPLTDVQKADSMIHADAAASQKNVDKYFDQAQDMLFEYGSVADERESLKSITITLPAWLLINKKQWTQFKMTLMA